MKKLTALFVVVFAVAFSSNVFAQVGGNTQTASADASATIILPINITKIQDLNFGTIASTTSAGWVTLDPTTEDLSSELTDQITSLSTPTAASFTVTGESGSLYAITLPGNEEIALSGEGDDMDVVNFTTDITGDISNLTLTGGSNTFKVGATLNVNAEQAAGEYTGSFDVTVAYN